MSASRPGALDRLRRWWRGAMPTRESIEQIGWLRPVAHRVLHPALWRFTRRSVPRGTALGLFVGIFLLIPGVQIAGAALLALPFRANVPVAAAMTFLSNPLSTPFLLIAALFVGNRLLGLHADMATLATLSAGGASFGDYARWLLADAAPALLVGLAIIAAIAAAAGYVMAALAWRWWIGAKWRRRAIRHRHG
ncbi:MAG TPA: DUF2062 domain-containing protein [Sphingomonadaceae bacterium]|nr:DUF2062 domain-containing protein [Sphingomonadaceae bacterium]